MEKADKGDVMKDVTSRYIELEVLRAGIFARRKTSVTDPDLDRMVSSIKRIEAERE